MKLYERLNLRPAMWDHREKARGVEICKEINPSASDYDRAWHKEHLVRARSVLALAYYYSEENELARAHGTDCIIEAEDFLLGEWRSQFQTPEKKMDPGWWKGRFIWMQVFEAALLWGSALGKWDFLKRVGEFPEPDSCVSDGYKPPDRDLYVAWGAFLRWASAIEIEPLIERVEAARGKPYKLVAALLRAGLARNSAQLQDALLEWMNHYRKNEFPKELITKKISVEGTFFVHWAEREGFAIPVPQEFADYIVRLA